MDDAGGVSAMTAEPLSDQADRLRVVVDVAVDVDVLEKAAPEGDAWTTPMEAAEPLCDRAGRPRGAPRLDCTGQH